MNDAKQRQINWQSIERALKLCDCLDRKTHSKSALRRMYLDGNHLRDTEYPLVAKLLFESATSGEELELTEEASIHHYFQLQGGRFGREVGFYFGENSLYAGREYEIYLKYFGKQKKFTKRKFTIWEELLLEPTRQLIMRIQINPYCQSWRLDQERFEWLKKQNLLRFIFNYKENVKRLSYTFCMIEWSHRYPEKFDENIQPIVSYFRDFYLNSNHPIKRAYQYTIKHRLNTWAESEGAGGKMYLALHYDNEQHLKNYLPLLDPKTRYPCDSEDTKDTIRSLPSISGDVGGRSSYQVIQALWRAGFSVHDKTVLQDNLLVLEINIPLSFGLLGKILIHEILLRDMENVDARIDSRCILPADSIEPLAVGEMVYLIAPLVGVPRVGTNAGVCVLKELKINTNEDIKNVVTGREPREFMPDLLGYREEIRDQGAVPPWVNPKTNMPYSLQSRW